MKACIINYADGHGWYPQGQARLAQSLYSVGGDPPLLAFSQEAC